MRVMQVAMVSMAMRTVITSMAVLRFGVIRLILGGGDNEVDGDDTGGRDNADGDVGASDRNVLVLVAMTKTETMKTKIMTMTTVIVVVMENWYKTLRTMMAVVPVLKKDPDDDNESVNAYGFDGGCVVDYDGESDD